MSRGERPTGSSGMERNMKILDFNYVRAMNIDPTQVYEWCNDVWRMKHECILPAKTKMYQGDDGRYITMPCAIPAMDIAGVKFISRNLYDASKPPARNSNIMVQQISKMGLLGVVDGIWITNMRTGAIAAHSAIEYAKTGAKTLGLMGLGLTARAFLLMLGSNSSRELDVKLLRYKDQAEQIIERFADEFPHLHFEIVESAHEVCSCDIVTSAISYANGVIAPDDAYKPGCTVVPIHMGGFQNCDLFFDRVIIDDHAHTSSFKYYEQFKPRAVEMGDVVRGVAPGRANDDERIITYCGGIALHDLYIASKVLELAGERDDVPEVDMGFPETRFWI